MILLPTLNMDLSQLSFNNEDYLVSDMSAELNNQAPTFTDFLILARPYTSDLCFNGIYPLFYDQMNIIQDNA